MQPWRLIVHDTPLAGSLNMAVDAFLFEALADAPGTTLRFYQWVRPTASLGASQKIERVVDADFCRRNGIDIVRRPTGGKVVLHHDELTYAVVSNDEALFGPTLGSSYRRISEALILGLGKLGLRAAPAGPPPPDYARGTMPCFSHPARDEIEIGGRKIVGSAQKRIGPRFLQHGSLPLRHDENLLRSVTSFENGEGIRMTSLAAELGRDVGFGEAVGPLAEGFAEAFGAAFDVRGLSEAEWAAVRGIEAGPGGASRGLLLSKSGVKIEATFGEQ
jgi:lipoate-protein ligase A